MGKRDVESKSKSHQSSSARIQQASPSKGVSHHAKHRHHSSKEEKQINMQIKSNKIQKQRVKIRRRVVSETVQSPSVPEVQQEDEVVCDDIEELLQTNDVDIEAVDELERLPSTPTPSTSSKASAGKAGSASKKFVKTTSSNGTSTPISNANNVRRGKRRRESATSSDEERWLTAIESGKLEDVDDELKKMKDPRLMTARQRAMYDRSLDKEASPGGEFLMSLPTGYREKEKPQTAEDIQKAVLKSQKRKQLADEKREKDKKKTMERLLKKQDSKQRNTTRNKNLKTTLPMISYKNTVEGSYIQLPPGYEFPLQAQAPRKPPTVQMCGIAGCKQPKVYNCSKTNLPLCSFACYRKNVQSLRQIMC